MGWPPSASNGSSGIGGRRSSSATAHCASCCLRATLTVHGADCAEIVPLGAKWHARTGYSDQLWRCCPLLIFALIDFLSIAGTMLYYMPHAATGSSTAYFGCKMSPRTALGSCRLWEALHSSILVYSASTGSPIASCNIDCID